MGKMDFDQEQMNFSPEGNDQYDGEKDLVGEHEYVTIIRIGNESSEVEVE